MLTQQQFYKSKKWEAFRKVIINERMDEDGFVHCAKCGKPIIKKYDLIIHHIKELDDISANDASIALNPDNVECVCFRCHNQIHERFTEGHGKTYRQVPKQVFVVYGSPCSGKSTFVRENATDKDLVVDLDSIWQMVSINDRYAKPNALRSVVFDIRDKMYDIIRYRSGNWQNAYVITGGALKGDRDRLIKRLGNVNKCIFIDTPMDECIKRVKKRDLTEEQQIEWIKYIVEWFERFQPDELSED